MRRLKQLQEAVGNARRPRACDENYNESAQWKSTAKNNAKNNAKRLKAGDEDYRESALAKYNAKRLQAGDEGYRESARAKSNAERLKEGDEGYRESARAKSNAERLKEGDEGYDESSRGKTAAALEAQRLQRDLDGRARRGEAEVQMEDLVEEVENDATIIMPFIRSFLASGHGVNILTASEHRTKPMVINSGGGITELPSTGVLPEPVELAGIPDGAEILREVLSL
jgi:hypothetical protein